MKYKITFKNGEELIIEDVVNIKPVEEKTQEWETTTIRNYTTGTSKIINNPNSTWAFTLC